MVSIFNEGSPSSDVHVSRMPKWHSAKTDLNKTIYVPWIWDRRGYKWVKQKTRLKVHKRPGEATSVSHKMLGLSLRLQDPPPTHHHPHPFPIYPVCIAHTLNARILPLPLHDLPATPATPFPNYLVRIAHTNARIVPLPLQDPRPPHFPSTRSVSPTQMLELYLCLFRTPGHPISHLPGPYRPHKC